MGLKEIILKTTVIAATLLSSASFSNQAKPALENNLLSQQSTAPIKENLDLPYDAIGEGEEEDAPEIVVFYGQPLEGNAFVYVIDKSSSMGDSGELDIAKREVRKNVTEFSENVEFGVIFFDRNVTKYPSSGSLVYGTMPNKASAISFINSITSGQGSCCREALISGLEMINKSKSERRILTYVGDGGGTCSDTELEPEYLRRTISSVTSANYKRAKINCIGVLNPQPLNEEFMKNLASSNNGNYTKISR